MAKGGVYGCAVFAKYGLFILNVIFFLLGIGLIAAGGVVVSNTQDFLAILGSTTNLIGGVIIGFGAFVFLTAFSGCCGALRESSCLLKSYFWIVVGALLVEATLAIIMFASPLFGDFVSTTGFDAFVDLNKTNTPLLESFEESVQCCGWKMTNDTYTADPTYPDFCFPNKDVTAKINPPCYNVVSDFFDDHIEITIAVIVTVIVIQLVGESMAVIMWRNIAAEDLYV
jgi:hypothetical protein